MLTHLNFLKLKIRKFISELLPRCESVLLWLSCSEGSDPENTLAKVLAFNVASFISQDKQDRDVNVIKIVNSR